MSGAGENNRWRRSGVQANRQSQQSQQNQSTSGTSTPTRDGGRQQAAAALSGNAWQGKGKAAGGGGGPQSPTVQTDSHVPVKSFNAGEVKEFLKKRYSETIGGIAPSFDTSVLNNASNPTSPKDQSSAAYHKVQGDSVAKRSSGAWGSRGNNMSHLMPNGQDFLTHLKKQLQTLEQGKPS